MSPEYDSITLNSETNPYFVVAQILQDEGLPVSISENATTPRGKRLTGFVQVVATGEGREALDKVLSTPEYRVLSEAALGTNGLFGVTKPNFSDCQWYEVTQRRILAHHFSNRARWFQNPNIIRPEEQSKYRHEIERAQSLAGALLVQPEPLSPLEPISAEDIHVLLEEVVGRSYWGSFSLRLTGSRQSLGLQMRNYFHFR